MAPTPKWTSPARVDAIRAEAPGHLLFTVLKHDPALRRQERCYKGRPDMYPIGRRKSEMESGWMQRLLVRNEARQDAENSRDL